MLYEDLGLDSFLRNINSPTVIEKTTGKSFDNSYGRGVISTSFVRSIEADRIRSGTVDASVITVANLDASNITQGTVSGTTIGIEDVSPNNLTDGTYSNAMNVGTSVSGYVKIDGANNRIIVNDGTVNRIAIGNI